MAGDITFSGLSTGLDTQSIIKQLMALEQRPIDRLETQKSSLNKRKSDFSSIRSKLSRLSAAANALDAQSGLSLFKATVSDEEKLSVSATGSALPGSHTIDVTTLAEAKTGSSNVRFADVDTTKHGTGSITFVVAGIEKTVEITSGANDTLAGIRDAINAADAGVQASTIYDGQGYKLVVSSEKTGLANAFSVSSDFSFLNEGTGFTQLNAAVDASFTLDGLAVTSAGNSVENALEGVTIDLKDVGANQTFTVERDVTEIGDKLQEFVDAFNEVQTALNGTEAKKDGSLASIRVRLGNAFGTLLSNTDFQLTGLAQVGITRDTTGKAKLDRSKLEDAVDSNFASVVALFRGHATNTTKVGIADVFDEMLNGDQTSPAATKAGILNSGSGLLALAERNVNDQVRRIDGRIESLTKRLDKVELQLKRKFANLEAVTSRYQATGSFLSGLR